MEKVFVNRTLSKKELFEKRKEMIKAPSTRAKTVLEPNWSVVEVSKDSSRKDPNPDLLKRLSMGTRVEISKKEMR